MTGQYFTVDSRKVAVFMVGCGSGSGSGRVDMGCWEGWRSSED